MSLDQLIYEKIPSLSAGQRKVAEYILNNKDEFSYATLAKLSKDISVSETTVIRFAYSLGFDSFLPCSKNFVKKFFLYRSAI